MQGVLLLVFVEQSVGGGVGSVKVLTQKGAKASASKCWWWWTAMQAKLEMLLA